MKKYQDSYFKRAKRENYAARSVYKLKEMDAKFRLFAPGQRVLDLGAAPGSWTQFAGQRVGPRGRVLAVDIQPTRHTFADNVVFVQADVFADDPGLTATLEAMGPFDLVLSDMAPKTTGIKFADQARSLELCGQALAVARRWLRPSGHFVVKMYEGGETRDFRESLRPYFERVAAFKPASSRSESKELFFVALGFRGPAE